MSLQRLALLAAAATLAVPCAVSAADRSSSAEQQERNREIVFDYASCVVKHRHDRAAEAILTNATREKIGSQYKDLIIGDCFVKAAGGDGQMSLGGDLFRYALADALVNADLSTTSEADFSNRAPLAHLSPPPARYLVLGLERAKNEQQRRFVQDQFEQQSAASWASHYGECIVRAAPVNSKAWLLLRPNAADEGARIEALKPTFAACLVEGQPIRFSRMSMRGLVAINYYRLAKANSVAGVGN